MTNRKSHTHFRLVPKSTTLDDLEGPLCTLFQNTYVHRAVITVRQTRDVFGKCERMFTTPEIEGLMLRYYGSRWREGVQNMIGIVDGFIRRLVISSLSQFFKCR